MADIFPQFPVQIAAMRQWPSELINWFVRMRYVLIRVAAGHVILPIGNRVVVTDSSGELEESDITDTELDSLDGIQSNVQTQINSKLFTSTAGGTKYWDDISFNFLSTTGVGLGVPALTDVNSQGRWAYAFTDVAVEAQEKRLPYGTQSPHGVVNDGPANYHLHFYTGSREPVVDEYIYVELVVGITPIGSVLSTTTLTKQLKIPSGTSAYTHLAVGHDDWDINPSGIALSADIGGTVRRKSGDANDTYADTVYMIYGDPHAQFDRGGTASEYS